MFEDVNLLIFVSLSDPDVYSAKQLPDIIPDPREDIRASVAAAIVETRGEGVCFWLEGCDEAPPLTWDSTSFLSKFVMGKGRTVVPSASIILTSRPTIPILLNSCLTRKVVINRSMSILTVCFRTIVRNISIYYWKHWKLSLNFEVFAISH
jgi:hypothetical protein